MWDRLWTRLLYRLLSTFLVSSPLCTWSRVCLSWVSEPQGSPTVSVPYDPRPPVCPRVKTESNNSVMFIFEQRPVLTRFLLEVKEVFSESKPSS